MIRPNRLFYLGLSVSCLLLAACTGQQSSSEVVTEETQKEDGPQTQHCIMIYQPVCALTSPSDRDSQPLVYKTFSNSCFANIERANVAFEGECGKLEGKRERGR